jgi:hypothetical protein
LHDQFIFELGRDYFQDNIFNIWIFLLSLAALYYEFRNYIPLISSYGNRMLLDINEFENVLFFLIVKCDDFPRSRISELSLFNFLYIGGLLVDCLLINYNSIPIIANFEIFIFIFIDLFGLKWINISARVKNTLNNSNAALTISLHLKGSIFLLLIFPLSIEVNSAAIRE